MVFCDGRPGTFLKMEKTDPYFEGGRREEDEKSFRNPGEHRKYILSGGWKAEIGNKTGKGEY